MALAGFIRVDMTSLQEVAFQGELPTTICGIPSMVRLSILRNYNTSIDMNLHGSMYTFNITRWMGGGMSFFMTLFHSIPREAAMFGSVVAGIDGVTYLDANVEQKLAAVKQACSDIVSCLNKIADVHKRGVMDYAVWYVNKHKEETTYSEFITLRTCQGIVTSDFLAPNVSWDLIQF